MRSNRAVLLSAASLWALATTAIAQPAQHSFDIPAQSVATSLQVFAKQSGREVAFAYDAVAGKQAPAIQGTLRDEDALAQIAKAGGLVVTSNDGRRIILQRPFPAPANAAPPPEPSPAPASKSSQLQEIVVTAQKRSENLQQVPIAVTAVTGAQLAASGVESTTSLGEVTPGLVVRTNSGALQPSIRGISTASNVVENPVALYIDGVYFPQQRDGTRQLSDISQIAVLKGPQGTLFGRNSTGGVIQISTRAPSHSFQGEASAEMDNYETGKVSGYVTGGLTDKIAASLSVEAAGQGIGWGHDYTTGNYTYQILHEYAARSKILYQPTNDTDITVILDYLDQKRLSNDIQPYPGTALYYPGVGPLKNQYDTYGGTDGMIGNRGGGASVTVDQQLGFAKLLSITSYRRGQGFWRFDDAAVPSSRFVVGANNAPSEDYTEEVQLISPKGQFNWVTGVFYFHNLNGVDPYVRTTIPGYGIPPSSVTNGNEVAQSVAPFAQADYEILPRTKLTFGVRYTYEDRNFNGSVATGAAQPKLYTGDVRIYRTTVRAVLDHEFSDDVLGYVSYNTGVKSGGFNILNPANPAYLPESLTAYEVGLKNQLFDRRMRLNLAAFYYQYTNIQVIQFSNGIQTIVNGAGAELYGLDADFEARITSNLKVHGGLELEHSEFTSFPGAIFSTPIPTGGATLFAASAKGNRLPLAQEYSGNVAVDYTHDIPQGALDFNLTANFNGSYYFEPDNFLKQGAYTILNASLTWDLPDRRYSLSIWGRNLLNAIVATQPSSQAIGYPAIYANPPLTFGGTARVKF